MEIQRSSFDSTNFGMKFVPNKSFIDTVKYAEKTGKLLQLDSALNKLKNVNDGDILIVHGKSENKVFSSFTLGKRSFPLNAGNEKIPEKVTLQGILNLAKLKDSKIFTKLTGNSRIKINLTSSDIISKY